jgi:hypothetical protein
VVTASDYGTARVWPWIKAPDDSPQKLVASIEQITCRKIAQDGGPAWIPPENPFSNGKLSESFGWFVEPTRTRTTWPGALQTVPQFIVREIQVEDNEQTAVFLRDYDLKRLPESCDYTKDLDRKEVLKLAAEMCAEQGDEERAQMARNKLKALESGIL